MRLLIWVCHNMVLILFLLSFLLGTSIGIGIILAFAQYQNIRSNHRRQLAATIAAFARMTVEDSRKILPAQYYPSWLVFSHRQKLTWLNCQLVKIWPYVNEATWELLKNSLEPTLEQYRPAIASSLIFSKFNLGTVAPQFTGISVVDGDANSVTMELELQWDGNPSIILDIVTKFGVKLPIQVKDIRFTGIFRIIFKPFVDEFPCFGAICYSLIENKNLDFTLKVVGGEISAIPGISVAIEETIRDAIEGSITWPIRQIIPILPGDYSDLEVKPVGTLEVKLIQGKDFSNKDLLGKSDPFAVLFVRPLRDQVKTSKTINNELNPIWNEHFEFVVEDASTQHITIRVYDDEGVQASELIGCAHVPLKELEPGKVKDIWLKLVKDLKVQRDTKNRGQVQLELLYCPFGTESAFTNPFDPDFRLTILEKTMISENGGTKTSDSAKLAQEKRKRVIMRGVLSVTVISAENLPVVDLIGTADPFVVLAMKKSQQKEQTRVKEKNLNPVWNETFHFVVEDGLHDLLMVEVWDHDTFGKDKIGRSIITTTRVILEGEIKESFPLDGAKSGTLNLNLKWLPQTIYRDT